MSVIRWIIICGGRTYRRMRSGFGRLLRRGGGCERAMEGIVYPYDEYGMDLDLDDLDPDTFY